MKMPLPPLPNSSGAPALPPRRGAPPPPVEQDEYDEFSVDDGQQDYDEFDIEEKSRPKPSFKPPAIPTEPDENYDEFEGSEQQSGTSVYVIGDDNPSPPPPPPPSFAGRPKLPKPPVHEEVEYMDPDEDENISSGSYRSNSSSGSGGPPPVPGHRKTELPSKVEKPKRPGQAIFSLDSSTLHNVKSKLKNVGFNKKPEKKNDEEKPKIFEKPLKPVTTKKPDKSKENGIISPKLVSEKPKPEKPKPEKPKPVKTKPEKPIPKEDLKESIEDNINEDIYDDAESLPQDPLSVHKWYHGLIDREESNKRLTSISSDGAFLIRKSTKDISHAYTLAVLYQNHIHNLKVRIRNDQKYALGEYKDNEVTFSTVPEVVEHHQKNDVILIGKKGGTVTLKQTPSK